MKCQRRSRVFQRSYTAFSRQRSLLMEYSREGWAEWQNPISYTFHRSRPDPAVHTGVRLPRSQYIYHLKYSRPRVAGSQVPWLYSCRQKVFPQQQQYGSYISPIFYNKRYRLSTNKLYHFFTHSCEKHKKIYIKNSYSLRHCL